MTFGWLIRRVSFSSWTKRWLMLSSADRCGLSTLMITDSVIIWSSTRNTELKPPWPTFRITR